MEKKLPISLFREVKSICFVFIVLSICMKIYYAKKYKKNNFKKLDAITLLGK